MHCVSPSKDGTPPFKLPSCDFALGRIAPINPNSDDETLLPFENDPDVDLQSGELLPSIAERKKLASEKFDSNKWKDGTRPPVHRKYFNMQDIVFFTHGPLTKEGNARTIVEANPDGENHCVFCHKEGSLIQCESVKKNKCCDSWFHISCAKNYNADGYQFQYSSFPECQNRMLCPLHCCATCNMAGRKQTAYAGEFLECAKCLRSFHPSCVPANSCMITAWIGDDDFDDTEQLMVVCALHYVGRSSEQFTVGKSTQELPKFYREIPRTLNKWRPPPKSFENKLLLLPESGPCNCKGENRCTTAECKYRLAECECPPSCEKNGPCNNRFLANLDQKIKVEKFKTERKGYGIRATEPIMKGECIIELLGELIDKKELNYRLNVPIIAGDNEGYCYVMQTAEPTLVIDATRRGNLARVANHSCDPNAATRFTSTFVRVVKNENDDWSIFCPRVYFVALKDIAEGEEITIKYKMSISHRPQPCYCGSFRCTGSMTGKSEEIENKVSDMEVTGAEQKARKKTRLNERPENIAKPV